MFSVVARRAATAVARTGAGMTVNAKNAGAAAAAGAPAPLTSFRQQQAALFSDKVGDGGIPDVNDTGPEKMEREEVVYNREPIHPPKGAGSKSKPFEVPSQHKERVVGFEHPESHALYWFPMTAGKLHYVEEIDRYFKLVPLS